MGCANILLDWLISFVVAATIGCQFWLHPCRLGFSSIVNLNFIIYVNAPCSGLQYSRAGVGRYLADFPAVFFHISHWYLSWNTNPSHKSQLSRTINYSVTHCFHDTTSSNVKETIHTSWDIQFLLSKVTSDINICYQMSSTVILPNFNFANEEFSVNVIIYICWHWHWIPSVISCVPHIHIYFFHLSECGMSFIFILWF